MRSLLFDGSSVIESGLSLTVICDCQKPDPAVDPDYVCDLLFLKLLHFICDRNIQKELAVFGDKLCRPEPAFLRKVPFKPLLAEREFDPSFQRIDGKNIRIAFQGIIAVPDQVQLRTLKVRFDPFLLIRKDRLKSSNNGTDTGFRHLGLQLIPFSDQRIEFLMDMVTLQVMVLENKLRYHIAGIGISLHGIEKDLFLRITHYDLQFSRDSLQHTGDLLYEIILSYNGIKSKRKDRT